MSNLVAYFRDFSELYRRFISASNIDDFKFRLLKRLSLISKLDGLKEQEEDE